MTSTHSSSLWRRPSTSLGWWAVWLAAAFVLMFIINSAVFMPMFMYDPSPSWGQAFLPFYGIFMMLCGLAAGVVALVAVIRSHERSWLVWLTLLPWAFAAFFVLGEFLVPH